MKAIRKSLNCTQTAFAEVLGIGFRTYVRYESGERDAPVSVLVKLARLGNISLDRLLTTPVDEEELQQPDTVALPKKTHQLKVIGGSLKEGRLMFKGLREDFLVTVNPNEKKLMTRFRQMSPAARDRCLASLEHLVQSAPPSSRKRKSVPRKVQKAKNLSKLKKIARTIKKVTVKG